MVQYAVDKSSSNTC